MIKKFGFTIYLLFFSLLIFSQGRFATVQITASPLSDNIYMLEGAGGNIGLYIGEKETFMIDDQFADLSDKIKAKIATLTDRPVSKLVNTHWHGDHTGGNESFGEQEAMIFAHENVYQRMSEKSPSIALPVVTYNESMHLRFLDEPVVITHVHNGHTDGDSYVYFTESNVLHMGDIFFHQRYPYIDLNSGGSLKGMIAAVEAASMMIDEKTKIIPGHGPMASKSDLTKYHTFLVTLKDRVSKAIASGTTEENLDCDAMLAGYEDWTWTFINAEKMAKSAFRSLKKDQWEILSDVSSLAAWKGWKKDKPAAAWTMKNGVLAFDPSAEDGGDILTKDTYENFEFHLEWKISDCGNSGLMWNVVEDEKYHAPYSTGPEMQILDNTCHPDGKIVKHRAGDLYDMIETNVVNVKPAGEWNSIIIKSNNAKYEFWQNGAKVVTFEMHGDAWDELVAGSKFKDWEGFGVFKSGHICLQDHGDKVWFRNIKIKRL